MLRRIRLRGAARAVIYGPGNRFPITRFCSKAPQNYKKFPIHANISGNNMTLRLNAFVAGAFACPYVFPTPAIHLL